jgi:VWFA-related protein
MSRLPTAPGLALAFLGLWVTVPAATQQQQPPQQPPPPVFRARTDIVRLDVTVLGPDGKPVHGLTREDFTLLEDGKPREILGFGEVNIPDASTSPPWLRDVRPDVRSALDGRVLVFILDDAQTSYRLETASWIRTVTRVTSEVIDRMGPQDVAAVICTYDNRCDQDFTNDHVRLKAAIARFTPKEAYIALRVSAGVTQSLAKYLKTEQGRRRSIIYVTPKMPIRPACWAPSAIDPTLDCRGSGSTADGGLPILRSTMGGDFGTWGGTENLTGQQILRTFEEAMRAGITVYGLDLRGLHALGTESRIDDIAGNGPPSNVPAGLRFTAPPRSLAAETGGFIVSQPEDLVAGAEQIITETGSYYLLGFEAPPKANTGYNMLNGFREIEVVVNRPGLTIKTHRGYIATEPPKPDRRPPPPATAALQGILPKTDLPLTVTAAPFAVPGTSEALVAIGIGVPEPAEVTRRVEQLEIQARAFTQGGDQRAGIIHKVDAIAAATRRPDGRFDVVVQLRLKPGVYALRCSADSTTLGVAGSVYADVEIPDFAKAPLSMSGVLLQVTPPPVTVFGASDILPGLPVAPTTQRTFTPANRVNAFLRVYQGSSVKAVPVALTLRILDEAGTSVYDQASTLAPNLFARTRGADVTVDVPVRQLAPGLHLLRIEASAGGATARREVTFRVQ